MLEEQIYKTVKSKITEIARFRGLTEIEAKERFEIELMVKEVSILFVVKLDGKPICTMEGVLDPKKKRFDFEIREM